MGLKFKDLSKSNKITYILFWTVSIICFLDMFIQFNIWIFFLGIMFVLKALDVKSEQKTMNLLDDYAEICFQQTELITDLTVKLNEANEKIKKLEDKKTTAKKKPATKKTTTAKKPVKKEAKKDATK